MNTTLNYKQDPINNLAQHMASLQKKVSELESRVETTNERLMSLAKASKERFERIQSVVSSLDFAHKKQLEDIRIEVARVTGMVTQKRVVDTKIEELIKNHTEMVSQIELRVQDLKKLYSEQNLKVSAIHSQLNSRELGQFRR